jgi:hypothetical protein
MDLTALTWQASVVLIYVSFYREAGVANATLASFLCPRPSLASRQLGSPSLAAFSRIRYRVCALAASVLSLRTCQEELQSLLPDDNIEVLSTPDRQSTRRTLAPINAWR